MQITFLPKNDHSPESKRQCALEPEAATVTHFATGNRWSRFPPTDLHADLKECFSGPETSTADIWVIIRDWLDRHQVRPVPQVLPQPSPVQVVRRSTTRGAAPHLTTDRPLIVTCRAESGELDWLGGLEGETLSDLKAAVELLRATGALWTAVVIDLDGFGSIGEVFEDIQALRDAADAPVIITSSHFNDDFSMERLPLCDVSVRAPASPTMLRLAFKQAETNYMAWKLRRAEARLRDRAHS